MMLQMLQMHLLRLQLISLATHQPMTPIKTLTSEGLSAKSIGICHVCLQVGEEHILVGELRLINLGQILALNI